MMDVHTWTSSFDPPVKYGGLSGGRATVAGDARSPAAGDLFEELAVGWLML